MDITNQERLAESLDASCPDQRPSDVYGGKLEMQSRRSIDWRDSGIVIDEHNQLFETLCNFHARSSIQSDHGSLACLQHNTTTTGQGTQTAATDNSPSSARQKMALEQDADGDTMLHLAVVGLSLAKARDLMDFCELNAINNMMQTPLHVAVLANRPEMVQLLAEFGAQLNVHDRQGNTPLHLASQRGLARIVEIILDAVASQRKESVQQVLGTCNFDGYTSLHLAAINDRRDIIELLVVRYGADLNSKDSKSGETIMHKAIRQFNVDLVAFILNLSNRQHCNGTDFGGREPLDTIQVLNQVARARGAQESLKLAQIEELIESGIGRCIEVRGCCSERRPSNGGDKFHDAWGMSDCSSSSTSEYSESDLEMD